MTAEPSTTPPPTVSTQAQVAHAQRRAVITLSLAQALSGVGVAGAVAAGALLAAGLGGEAAAGLTQTAGVLGAALLSLPLARLALSRGRRVALSLGFAMGGAGAAIVVIGGVSRNLWLVLVGSLFLGVASAAGYQGRYAATDLAPAKSRGRALSIVVWAGTLGAVLGPNLLAYSGSIAIELGMPQLTGPFLLATVVLVVAAGLVLLLLRPDPYLLARSVAARKSTDAAVTDATATDATASALASDDFAQTAADGNPGAEPTLAVANPVTTPPTPKLRDGISHLREHPRAMLGVAAVSTGHVAMVMVMVMTPVHMAHVDVSLRLIGLVISVHVLGMFGFSPIVGWAVDRYGREQIILLGCAILLVSAGVSGLAPADDVVILGIGLFLLGLGWSCTLIGGSTLLTDETDQADRPSIQGLSDLSMNVAGALGGAVAGLIVVVSSYAVLCAASAVPVFALIGWVLRVSRRPSHRAQSSTSA